MSRNRLQPIALALALALGAALNAQAAAPEPPMPLGADGLYWGDGPASQYSPGESMKAHAACREVRDLRPPHADFADAAAHPQPKNCDPLALYYGLDGTARDVVAARRCALPRMNQRGDSGLDPDVVLTNIYANGEGVPRNLDLATRFACTLVSAPAEYEGPVNHLQDLKLKPAGRFDYCNDITSGWAAGECAAIDAGQAAGKRMARLAQVTRGWSPAEEAALKRVHAAEEAFAEAHSEEQDLSGTMRGAFFIGYEEAVRSFSLALLDRLAAGKPASAKPTPFAAADRELNLAYRKALAAVGKPRDYPGPPKPDDVRKAQRLWIAYRDAWTALARLRWPQGDADAVAAALTRDRTKQLKKLAEDYS